MKLTEVSAGLALVVLTSACSKPPSASAPAPTLETRIVYIVVTPTNPPRPEITAASYQVPTLPTAVAAPVAAVVPQAVAAQKQERPYCVIEDFLTRPVDSAGAVWFDGEVKNLGSQSVKVKVLVKAYSINETLLDSKETYAGSGRPISPGERAHFHSYVESNTGQPIYKVLPEVVPQ